MVEKTKSKNDEKNITSYKDNSTQSLSSLDDVDRLFDEFLSRNWLSPFQMNFPARRQVRAGITNKLPDIDVIDRAKEILIRAEVPGFDKKDLKVTMTNQTVTITGESRKEEKEEKGNYFRREITKESFSRVVGLPCEVDVDKAKLAFQNGVLELVVPKNKEVKQRVVKIEDNA